MAETTRLDPKFFRSFAIFVGSASLLLFLVFLFDGALNFIQMGLNHNAVLLWDGFISIIFFVQHSVMIRRGFCSWFASIFQPFITELSSQSHPELSWQGL